MSENETIYSRITWEDLVSAVRKKRKFVISLFLVGTCISIFLAFILPEEYESKTTILPISSSPSSLSNVSDLAALAGISLNTSDETNKILIILNSRTLRERVIKKLNLIPILVDKDDLDNRNPLNIAIEKLEKKVSVIKNKKLGSISISVLDRDPVIARNIASAYIDETRKLLNEKRLSVAKFDRIYLEKKLKEEEKFLNEIQKRLAKFQKETKLIDPNSQLKNILDLYLSLLSKRTEILFELNSLSVTLSKDSPKIKNLKKQILFIDKQLKKIEEKNKFFPSLKKIPEILSEYTDIMRKLKTSQAIYETLMKLYQQARLSESKERLFIEVIDPPSLPDIPSKPNKKLIIFGGSLFSLILGFIGAIFLECCKEKKRDEQS